MALHKDNCLLCAPIAVHDWFIVFQFCWQTQSCAQWHFESNQIGLSFKGVVQWKWFIVVCSSGSRWIIFWFCSWLSNRSYFGTLLWFLPCIIPTPKMAQMLLSLWRKCWRGLLKDQKRASFKAKCNFFMNNHPNVVILWVCKYYEVYGITLHSPCH
jgi:hypothetical protein